MEAIAIKNFLVIKEADIKANKITLIIGPQANGKSVIAKLLYFFREFLSGAYLKSVQNSESKRELEKRGLSDFEQYFPRYTWEDQDFELIYTHNDIEISILHNKNQKTSTKLDYSKNLVFLHKKLKSDYKQKLAEFHEEEESSILMKPSDIFRDILKNSVYNSKYGDSFQQSVFIPASRSFFANLQKNLFTFLADNIDIDPFIKDFGSRYVKAKQLYDRSRFSKEIDERETRNKIKNLAESILAGKYRYENEQDWIENKSKRINLVNASSGQQEALPMLVILSIWPFLGLENNRRFTFFIEEPEAHLFPVSQKHITSIVALVYKKKHHNFVITTHSPYILTALNNMILADEVSKDFDEGKIQEIIDPDFLIDYKDVSAYTIKNGVPESILDEEAKLIGSTVIDAVSDDFDQVFDSLLQLQLAE